VHRLSPIDLSFLVGDTRETPMHVGGLYVHTFPEGVDERAYLADLVDLLKNVDTYRVPFGHRLDKMGLHWIEDDELDPDYHVRHSALAKPGTERELFQLAARLHQTLLDRHRPLWEVYVIEGLTDRRFAVYAKVHHATIDGVGALRLLRSILSHDPDERRPFSPLSEEARQFARAQRPPRAKPSTAEVRTVAEAMRETFGAGRHVLKSLGQYVDALWHPERHAMRAAWAEVPHTSFTTKVTGARRMVGTSVSFPRVRRLARAFGGTVNDTVLTLGGSALRRYLLERSELPDKPLTAMTPVNLRPRDAADELEGQETGNSVGMLMATLGTHLADPAERFRAVKASMDEGKALARQLSRAEMMLFTEITQVPPLVAGLLGFGHHVPAYSTVISNLPGPEGPIYWNGARLEAMYPMSAIFHGFGLNMTLITHDDRMDFGLVACRETVPEVERIAGALGESLAELEEAAGLPPMADGEEPVLSTRP
jgi:diacylglycerol O-acyltransferase